MATFFVMHFVVYDGEILAVGMDDKECLPVCSFCHPAHDDTPHACVAPAVMLQVLEGCQLALLAAEASAVNVYL